MVRAALAVAALLVLAGCGGAVSTHTGTPAADGTDDPATAAGDGGSTAAPGTTDATATAGNDSGAADRLPPGVTVYGVNLDILVLAHRRSLERASVTVTIREAIVADNGTTLAVTRTEMRSHGDRVAVHQVVGGASPAAVGLAAANFTYWSAGEETAMRRVLPDGRVRYSYFSGDGPRQFRFDQTGGSWVLGALSGRNVSVDGTVRRANVTLVVLRASTDRTVSVRGQVRRNLTLRVYVSRIGMVRSFRLQYDTVIDGHRVTVSREFQLSDFADTPVERPGWVDRARNESLDEGGGVPP